MTDDNNNNTRKKKRGRKNKFFLSCFPSLEHKPFLCDNNTKNGRLLKIPVDNNDCINTKHRPRVSRLVKAVLFGSLTAKKIHRSSSKSSMASDTSGSYVLTYDKPNEDNNVCVRDCEDPNETLINSRCRSNLLTSSSCSSTSSQTNCSSSSSSTFSTSRSSSCQQKSSSQIDLVYFRPPKSFLDQKVSFQIDPRHLRHQDSSVSVSLPLSKPKTINSIIPKSLSFHKGLSQLDSSSLCSLTSFIDRDKTKLCSRNNRNIIWCFFLFLSLVVLVIYGRIFSILCTSTWFYFVPCHRRVKRVNSTTNVTTFMDTDSEQYKKRIIMAGLLDRTRNPFR